eukprot:COSAG01_NODE_10300_length_2196_cov_1.215817_2_plen_507_part_01
MSNAAYARLTEWIMQAEKEICRSQGFKQVLQKGEQRMKESDTPPIDDDSLASAFYTRVKSKTKVLRLSILPSDPGCSDACAVPRQVSCLDAFNPDFLEAYEMAQQSGNPRQKARIAAAMRTAVDRLRTQLLSERENYGKSAERVMHQFGLHSITEVHSITDETDARAIDRERQLVTQRDADTVPGKDLQPELESDDLEPEPESDDMEPEPERGDMQPEPEYDDPGVDGVQAGLCTTGLYIALLDVHALNPDELIYATAANAELDKALEARRKLNELNDQIKAHLKMEQELSLDQKQHLQALCTERNSHRKSFVQLGQQLFKTMQQIEKAHKYKSGVRVQELYPRIDVAQKRHLVLIKNELTLRIGRLMRQHRQLQFVGNSLYDWRIAAAAQPVPQICNASPTARNWNGPTNGRVRRFEVYIEIVTPRRMRFDLQQLYPASLHLDGREIQWSFLRAEGVPPPSATTRDISSFSNARNSNYVQRARNARATPRASLGASLRRLWHRLN